MPTIKKQHTKINFTNKKINVKYIVEHDTGVLGQTAKGNATYFGSAYRGSSAHYFVDKNDIIEVIPPGLVGWHVGDDKSGDNHDVGDLINNYNTVGIELCAEKDGRFHKNTLENAAWLTQKLMKDHNVPASRVVRHYDASGKNCPQRMNTDGKWTLWKKYHSQLTGQVVISAPSGTFVGKDFTHKVVAGDTLWGLSKQYNATVAQIKEWNGLKTDTIVIGDTLKMKASNTSTSNPKPVENTPKATLRVDGYLGRNVVIALQRRFNTPVDGVISGQVKSSVSAGIDQNAITYGSGGSMMVRTLQKYLGITVDGNFGPATLKALQRKLGTPADGVLSRPSLAVKELQRRLNNGTF